MTIYYFVRSNRARFNYKRMRMLHAIGSVSRYKIERMAEGCEIHTCDISEFVGNLLSSEYL